MDQYSPSPTLLGVEAINLGRFDALIISGHKT